MSIFVKFKISKSAIAITCFMLSISWLYAEFNDVYIEISPKSVAVGESAEFYLISAAGFPEIDKLPSIPGLVWNSATPINNSSTRIIKARRVTTYKTIYQFTALQEGTMTIPAIQVKIGHIIKKLQPVQFKAYKRKVIDNTGKEIDLDTLLYSSALLMTNRDTIYVGEEVPLEIRIYSLNGLGFSYSWPQIDIENIVMKDYSSINPQSSYFQPPKSKTIRQNNKMFKEDILKAALRPISPGTLSGKVVIPCQIEVQREKNTQRNNGNSLSDLLSMHFFQSKNKRIEYRMNADVGPKKVIPLPALPKDSYYTGLVGEWDLQYSFSIKNLKAGEPATLKIILKGKGTLDALSVPEINIEGCRIYPPEITKDPNSSRISNAEIRYAIIPKSAGDLIIDISFSTFSPLRGKYIIKRFVKEFQVAKNNNMPSGSVAGDVEINQLNEDVSHTSEMKEQNGILYLKPVKSGSVMIPLQNNKLLWIILVLIAGPIVLILSEILSYKKQKLTRDPLLKRKNSAKKKKRTVINRIQLAKDEDELHSIIQNDLTPLINDLHGYPPGTTTDELAQKVDNQKLSACLKAGSSSSYMPGNRSEYNAETLKKHLLTALKRLSIVIFLFCCASIYAEGNMILDKDDPQAAYDRKDTKTAEAIYKSQLDPKNPDPAWVYNLGNCEVQKGNLPQALVYYERARRLDPGDSDILENLNFVRRKLLQPEIGTFNTPIDSFENFRDSFRPDSWILIIAVMCSTCCLTLAFRRLLSPRKWGSTFIISFILLVLSILAYISQQNSTYNSSDAIVVQRGVPVYMLPSEKAENAGFKLRAGEEIRIEEERHNWLRIRQNHSEGWVKSDSVKRLWPY